MRSLALLGLLAGALLLPRPTAAQDVQTRLWDGAIAGDTAAIRRATVEGAKVDALDTRRNPNGRLALNWAAWYNHAPAVALLLKLGAPIEATNVSGFSALHHAAEAGSLDAARVLLSAGADPAHANGAGLTPAQTARAKGHDDMAVLLETASRAKKPAGH